MAQNDETNQDDDGRQFSDLLQQDEIDQLLGFKDNTAEGPRSGVEAIVDAAIVSYERLPMLEVIYDRLVRLLSTSMRNFTSDNVEVNLEGMTSIRFGDYISSVPLPAMIVVFKAEEWDNFGLAMIDSSLVYSIVDVLLGGRHGTSVMRVEGRPYTTIERSLVEKMLQVVLTDLSSAFEPIAAVTMRYDRLETNPRFASIARPDNATILGRLRIDMDGRGGRMDILLPYATLEPVRELLLQQFMGEKFGRDSIWENHLATELWSTDVLLKAVLERMEIPLRDILKWKEGSFVSLTSKPGSAVEFESGRIPIFRGMLGQRENSLAVKVFDQLSSTEEN